MTADHSTQAAHYANEARAARVEATARALLRVIDCPQIRQAALDANFALYESAAALIDALGDGRKPDCIYCGKDDHWSQDCPPAADLVLERLPNDTHAWLRPEARP